MISAGGARMINAGGASMISAGGASMIHLTEYLERTAALVPDRTAVIDGGAEIDFKTLAGRAKALSHAISDSVGGKTNAPVAVYMEKSIACVASDLAVLYSGNAYMNLDVKAPAQRIRNIIGHIKPAAILTNNAHVDKIAELAAVAQAADAGDAAQTAYAGEAAQAAAESVSEGKSGKNDEKCHSIFIINYDEIDFENCGDGCGEGAGESGDGEALTKRRLAGLISTDPSCIINTSGSTGTPKGVVLNHLSFFDFTEWAVDTLGIGDNEIVGSLSPTIFDIYSFELCMLMARGSTMLVIPDSMSAFPVNILSLMQKHKVSFIFWVPTIMVNIANMGLLEKIGLPDLKTVWFAGEIFPTRQLNIWRRSLPSARFINLYGPIEITLDCTYFVVDRDFDDGEPLPIGFPCRNTDILILKEDGVQAGVGEEGELCVRGASLAMGYYNDPEKTAAAFTQNPLNTAYPETIYRTGDVVQKNGRGEIMFKGRKDTLVKHLGYRIELGEIEHVAINALKLVKNGCAVYDADNKEIAFYYEPLQDGVSAAGLRKVLSGVLPKYMIPTKYIRLDGMPMNPNGKIDRLRLKQALRDGEQ